MKAVICLCSIILLVHFKAADAAYEEFGTRRCVNMWDEGCINGQLPGAGGDDEYLNGGFNPGKRCINVWDEGCNNGPIAPDGDDFTGVNVPPGPGRRFLYELLDKLRRRHHIY